MLTLIRRSLAPGLLLLGVGACSRSTAARPTAGTPAFVDSVDARAVAKSVVLCTTTGDELRRRLGEPTRDGIIHAARVLSWSTRSQSPSRYLAVLIDGRGVVVDLYWDAPTEAQWVPTDQCGRP